MQAQPKTTAPTPPASRRDGSAGTPPAREGTHRPPSSVDSVLESIGKAVTEPIRDASDEDDAVPATGSGTGRPGA